MRLQHLAFTLFLLLLTSACQHPSEGKKWYRGNLHTHSYWSDGDEFPEMIMDWYKSKGYQFVALSDHNVLAQGEHWMRIPDKPIYLEGFEKYKERFGENWVVYKEDSGRIEVLLKTYEEYRSQFEESGQFIILQAEEITDHFEKKPLHLNASNIQSLISPQGGSSVAEILQNNINQVLEQSKQTGEPIIPHVNHPNFGYAITLDDMIQLNGERFFEVYNGHPLVYNNGDSSHMGTENMWDMINIAYTKRNQSLMYGLATDDSHHYHTQGAKYANAGRGWIMVNADSLNPRSLMEAMVAGKFYASTGVTLSQITFLNNKLHVEVKPEQDVKYDLEFIGCYKNDEKSRVLFHNRIIKGEFQLDENIVFVRAKVTSSKPMENSVNNEMETAWTQPVVFIRK